MLEVRASDHVRHLAALAVRPLRQEGRVMTLTEFLLARITEDEERRLLDWAGGEVEAVDAIRGTLAGASVRLGAQLRRVDVHLSPFLNRHRALKYADHPDYREEWKV